MKFFLRIAAGMTVVALILLKAVTVTLLEGNKMVITHFGKPDRIIKEAGLHFKWPWPVDDTYVFDARKKVYNTRYTQTLTRDKRAIILMTYVLWNIDNPLVFLQSVGTTENAETKLDGLVSNAKNNILGNYDLEALVSVDEDKIRITEIEEKILNTVFEQAREKFGVQIDQIGIKRVAFPQNNVAAIFEQMKTERAQYAARYRAEGRKEASKIRSDTELEAARITAAGKKEAEEIRGKADRLSAEIYADAHSQGKKFYQMKRSLEALEKLVDKNAVFVMRNDQPPFDVLYKKPAEGADGE